MELQISKQAVAVNETVASATAEIPVEFDLVLPDYCPDIVRILKCSGSPAITNTYVSGDKLIAEGTVTADIYYKSPEKELCKAESKFSFQKTLDLKSTPENPIVSVRPRIGYFNCRAINPRRVDMRGAVGLVVNVTAVKEEEVVSSAEGMGVQLRPVWVEAGKMIASEKKNFSVKEDVRLPSEKPGVSSVIRTSAIPNLTDKKVVDGKVILKGDLEVSVLYRAQNDERTLETANFTLPMSTIADVAGIDEDCICSPSLSVTSVEAVPRPDAEGSSNVLGIETSVTADITAGTGITYPLSADCYGTKYDTKAKSKTIAVATAPREVKERIIVKEMIDFPAGATCITDIWVETDSINARTSGTDIVFYGKVNVQMFGEEAAGETELFEHTIAFEQTVPFGGTCEIPVSQICFNLASMNFNIGDGRIDFRCEIAATGIVMCETGQKVITEIIVDPEKPARADTAACLNVYFADKGESVWEIAKRYNANPSFIMEENNLASDTLPQKQMLLIPIF